MKKYSKMFIGLAIIIGTWLVGFLLWQFLGTSVRMNASIRDLATIFIGISFLPSLLMYIIWYFSYLKAQKAINEKMPKGSIYAVFGSVLAALVVLAPMIILGFSKAATFVILTIVLIIVGSLLAYKVGEPQ